LFHFAGFPFMTSVHVGHRLFKFSSDTGDSCLTVTIPELVDTSYGLFVWSCAPLLAQYVFHQRETVFGKHVLEIGCGTSLPGIVAAKLGAKVTLSDSEEMPHCLERAKQSCAVNGMNKVAVIPLTWGVHSPCLINLAPIDIILGSDCFYDSKDFEPIIATVAYLLGKNRQAEFWTTYEVRSVNRSIEHLLSKWNLCCHHVPLSDFASCHVDVLGPSQSIQPHDAERFQMLVITRAKAS
jgi:predicted nicotinamide N-methyase